MNQPPRHRVLQRDRYTKERVTEFSSDISVPNFAHHDAHVALVMGQGGFCWFSERRLSGKDVAVCMPVVWPR